MAYDLSIYSLLLEKQNHVNGNDIGRQNYDKLQRYDREHFIDMPVNLMMLTHDKSTLG